MANPLLIIAVKEFRDGLRNRWVLTLSILFAVLSIGLSYFGAAASGQAGISSLQTTMVSLATLVVMLIPLISLMLAYDSVSGEEERGTLLLLMTYPVQRWHFICGKMLGHGLTLACAIVIGFALSAVITGFFSDSASWMDLFEAYGFFTFFSILLSWVFIAMAYMVSVHAHEKSSAAVMALLLWFSFVLMFDMILLGILVSTQGNVNETLFPYLLLLNPADIYRLAIIQFFSDQSLTGLMSIAQHAGFTLQVLIASILLWLLVPLIYAVLKFNKRQL